MSQHLIRNLVSKQFIHELPSSSNYQGSLSLPAPAHAHQHSVVPDQNQSSIGSLSTVNTADNDSIIFNPDDGPCEGEDMLERNLPTDPNLQDVVSYPTA